MSTVNFLNVFLTFLIEGDVSFGTALLTYFLGLLGTLILFSPLITFFIVIWIKLNRDGRKQNESENKQE